MNGVSQLERLTQSGRFREAASSLSAVKSLLSSFQEYSGVERVASIQRQVASLQKELGDKAKMQFETYFTQDGARAAHSSSLSDAALVIDTLGSEAKAGLIEFYTTYQLREYRRIFRATDEAGQLDNVARRFAWFRRILKIYDEEHASIFEEGPVKQWNVARELLRKFTELTRQDIRSVLIRTQGKLQVPVLLEALGASLEFEKAMSKRFGMPFAQVCSPEPPGLVDASAQSISLSSVFEPYLYLFVEAQDRALAEMIQTFRSQGSRTSMDEGKPSGLTENQHHTVLPSSTELFYFYGQVLEQCARLSTREPFRDLTHVYEKHLQSYAEDVLQPMLARHEPTRRSVDVRSSVTELQKHCLVINTADYCASTCKQLEAKLKEKIDQDFKDQVQLDAERDLFLGIVSAGIMNLTRELEVSIEGAFNQMLKAPWSAIEPEDVKSAYVDEFASALEHVAVVVRQDVQSKRYVRSWCDKVVNLVLTRFTYNIIRLKPISPSMAQQMLTDIGEIRMSLLELPRYSLAEEGSTSAAAS